jgi:hypothetical protein
VQVDEHAELAAHHDQRDENGSAESKPEAGGQIHEALQMREQKAAATRGATLRRALLKTCKG